MRALLLLCLLAPALARAQNATSVADAGVEQPSNWQPITWGELDPGRGFQVAKTELGDLWVSGYAVVRYINQLPATQSYVDHLGRERVIDTRHDVSFHRALLNFRGFLFLKKFEYVLT